MTGASATWVGAAFRDRRLADGPVAPHATELGAFPRSIG
jgi:hypothetical protein